MDNNSRNSSGTHLMRSLLFSLSILKEKVNEVESFINFCVHQNDNNQPLDYQLALSNTAHLVRQVSEAASCLMLNCQQMEAGSSSSGFSTTFQDNGYTGNNDYYHQNLNGSNGDNGFCYNDWYIPHQNNFAYDNGFVASNTFPSIAEEEMDDLAKTMSYEREQASPVVMGENENVVELDASDLLATCTHYCEVCGRGFKREANLKMHMRAHGDQYKISLNNNTSSSSHEEANKMTSTMTMNPAAIRYSCPQEGCRWNKKHAKFQPLKSIVCVKNHYKRSHCPKMFMCKRCNTKQFSVLSDLKTHEKHCGDDDNYSKWYCSCGTSFLNKEMLMDHVAMIDGHTPLITNLSYGRYQASS